MNLLQETTEMLERNGYRIRDIRYITDEISKWSWETFSVVAQGINYDESAYPTHAQINLRLMVVLDDAIMHRQHNERREGWRVRKLLPTLKSTDDLSVGDLKIKSN